MPPKQIPFSFAYMILGRVEVLSLVKVPRSATVSELADAIKAREPDIDVPASMLGIWKVSHPT